MAPSLRAAFSMLLLVSCVGATFLGTLDNPFVSWDDGIYVVHNPLVTEPGEQLWSERLVTTQLGYPLPLPVFIYGLLWRVGQEAWLFHAFSMLVHASNAMLLRNILVRQGLAIRTATLAAMVFSVHPIVVEPVAWVTGLKDLLVGTGVLLAVRAMPYGPPAVAPGVLVALASKPSAVLLGPAFTLLGPQRRSLVGVTVLGMLTLLGLAITSWSLTHEPDELRTRADVPWSATRPLGALGLHLGHVLLPDGFSHLYPIAVVQELDVVVGAGGALVLLWLGIRWCKAMDPRAPWMLVGVAVYLPASNLLPLHRFTADSFFYVPWLAFTACLAHGWHQRRDQIFSAAGRAAALVSALPWLLLPTWMVLSWWRVEDWSSDTSLWASAVDSQPGHGELVYRYGEALGKAGRFDDERALYAENLGALERFELIPGPLPLFFERAGDLDGADHWYGRAFASSREQSILLYWQYAEYIGRHPERVRPEHSQALVHSTKVYLERARGQTLDADERSALAAVLERLGRLDLARSLQSSATTPAPRPDNPQDL